MKVLKPYLIKAFLITSALILVMSSPGYCAQKNISTIISLLLTDSRPSMQDTATKAAANLGGPVNASLAILLAADRGYSWIQIVDAIEVGNLQADGSIPGISPEDDPHGIITVSEQTLVLTEKTLLITASNSSPTTVAKVKLIAAIGEYSQGGNVLDAIIRAICNGYSIEQIVAAIISDTLYPSGIINCLPADAERNDCMDGDGTLIPKGKIFEKAWVDCKSPNLPNIQGKWQQPGYFAVIEGFRYKYTLTGSGPGNFLHTGTITWYSTNNWYEGNLADVDGYCCGNIGYIWVKVKDENTISIKSYWTTPEGDLVKDNTEVWTDMTLYSRDVD